MPQPLKIALAQLNFHVANFDYNLKKIIENTELAIAEKADIIVFPELAVCAYPPRDFLEFNFFINRCQQIIIEIAKSSQDIAIIIGAPTYNKTGRGKKLHNSAFFLSNGEIKHIYNKGLLPTYDVFDEFRYFEPAQSFEVVDYKGHKIALTICEDLWDEETEDLDGDGMLNKTYSITPMEILMKQNPDLIINIAASPFDYTHAIERKKVLSRNAAKYKLPLVYVNHVGAQTELIFDGGSAIINANGEITNEAKYFEEQLMVVDLFDKPQTIEIQIEKTEIETIYNALLLGISDFFKKMNFGKAILGLSGGIDSALVCALAAKALGADNVHAVLLPSKYSSEHSILDALKLVETLGISHQILPIQETVDAAEKTLSETFMGMNSGLAEENLQARTRAILLMAISNKFGYILLNTSNKSEAAVGYGTLYGDMSGGLSVIADLYKTQVYELCNFINKEIEIIPKNTIVKPPSAELRPNQKDSDSLPDYDLLDKVLFQYIENRKGADELIAHGFDEALVQRITKLVNANEFKRHQTPPILRVSPKSFGMGRRMPIVAKYN
jgi:NAD+ synthase (glutamine-hydrolysing)